MSDYFRALSNLLIILFVLAAANGLTGCGKEKKSSKVDVSAQIAVLKGSDGSKKADALAALSAIGAEAEPAMPVLIETLKDPEAINRRLAALVLGQIGKPAASAIPALRALMTDSDRDVVTSVIGAIRNIDPNSPEAKANLPNVMTP